MGYRWHQGQVSRAQRRLCGAAVRLPPQGTGVTGGVLTRVSVKSGALLLPRRSPRAHKWQYWLLRAGNNAVEMQTTAHYDPASDEVGVRGDVVA